MSDRILGDNNPPIGDRLDIAYAWLREEIAAALSLDPLPAEDIEGHSATAADLRKLAAKIEKHRKAEKAPILVMGEVVDTFFKTGAIAINGLADFHVSVVNAWQKEQLRLQREAQAAEVAAAKAFDEPIPAPVAAKDAGRVVGASGKVTAAATTKWVYKVTNAAYVPAKYLQVNDAAVKAAIAGGVREIPGLEITEELVTTIRRK
jgi:hypothetical protein